MFGYTKYNFGHEISFPKYIMLHKQHLYKIFYFYLPQKDGIPFMVI